MEVLSSRIHLRPTDPIRSRAFYEMSSDWASSESSVSLNPRGRCSSWAMGCSRSQAAWTRIRSRPCRFGFKFAMQHRSTPESSRRERPALRSPGCGRGG